MCNLSINLDSLTERTIDEILAVNSNVLSKFVKCLLQGELLGVRVEILI